LPLRALLFDKDGTLIDFDRTWGPAALTVMRALAADDPARFDGLVQLAHYDVAAQRFAPTSPLLAGASSHYGPAFAEVLGRPADAVLYGEMDRLFLDAGLTHLTPLGDPLALMQRLQARGLPLGIATNDAEASARAQAARLGFLPHLAFIAGYDSGFGAKPHPGQVTAFAGAVGVAVHEIALIGDTRHDLDAARAAGALAVAVLTGPRGHAARADLAPHADHVIDTLDDLIPLLDALDAALLPA
jgi:phosphoglycolate phosphatase